MDQPLDHKMCNQASPSQVPTTAKQSPEYKMCNKTPPGPQTRGQVLKPRNVGHTDKGCGKLHMGPHTQSTNIELVSEPQTNYLSTTFPRDKHSPLLTERYYTTPPTTELESKTEELTETNHELTTMNNQLQTNNTSQPTTSPPPDEASPTQTPEDIEQGYMKITQITYENETRGSLPPLLPQTKGRIN